MKCWYNYDFRNKCHFKRKYGNELPYFKDMTLFDISTKFYKNPCYYDNNIRKAVSVFRDRNIKKFI